VLRQQLDWEEDMVQTIVDTITHAATRNVKSELEDIVQVRYL
jgi:hypothetical protein